MFGFVKHLDQTLNIHMYVHTNDKDLYTRLHIWYDTIW